MRIYLDAAPIIDYIELTPVLGPKVAARINAAGMVLISSDLAILETLVLPLRTGNAALVKDYEDFFALRVSESVPLTSSVFRNAATIRAQRNYKTPDALHLAAAIEAGCDVFLTNDLRLKSFPGITVEVVS